MPPFSGAPKPAQSTHDGRQERPIDSDIALLLERLRGLEAEIERRLEKQRRVLRYKIRDRRAVFEQGVHEQHRRFKVGLGKFLRSSRAVDFLLIAPVTYSLVVPFVLLDALLWLYQRICFSAWRIPRVSRSDYIVIHRHRLGYLNGIQKLNCLYCSYANGLIALVGEVASRTEAYWCPIKHSLRVAASHARYRSFLEYGDAEGFATRSESYRTRLRAFPAPTAADGNTATAEDKAPGGQT
jgi:hypothetical protein